MNLSDKLDNYVVCISQTNEPVVERDEVSPGIVVAYDRNGGIVRIECHQNILDKVKRASTGFPHRNVTPI